MKRKLQKCCLQLKIDKSPGPDELHPRISKELATEITKPLLIIFKQSISLMTSHMRQNDLFSKKQFGFITGRSTTLQLLEVLDKLTQEVDSGGKVDCICKYGLPESV